MRQRILATILSAAALISSCSTPRPSAEEVMALTRKVADWQIDNYERQGEYRALPPKELRFKWHHRERYPDQDWIPATLFAGMYRFSTIVGDEDYRYINWLDDMAAKCQYKLFKRPFHADDHAVGQMYLNLADQFGDEKYYRPTQEQFDMIMTGKRADAYHWHWCDALFMAPPVWCRLAKVTGEEKYLDYMDLQYHKTYDELWSSEESLFYRDKKFFTQHEANGKGVFWSRGNGWVFGGLAMMIPDMPKDWAARPFYIELFQTMAARLKELQREDGTWSAGLLGDVSAYENIETSGSAFFTFGIAWGINYGLLERKEYEPMVLKAWSALAGAVSDEGLFGYVQGVGAAPGASYKEYSELYGTGAFLAAASEIYKLVRSY
ncbi:MAG: glycoside hydrolase family 88 protein [Rikenellaceae bacterium]